MVEFLNVNRSKVVHDGFLRWKTRSVHANGGLLVGGSPHLSSRPGSFSSSGAWPQISSLRSALVGHHRGMPGISIVGCRVAQCTLPLQLSQRKQISNVALNKPSQWSDLRVPGHSTRAACVRIIGRSPPSRRG